MKEAFLKFTSLVQTNFPQYIRAVIGSMTLYKVLYIPFLRHLVKSNVSCYLPLEIASIKIKSEPGTAAGT